MILSPGLKIRNMRPVSAKHYQCDQPRQRLAPAHCRLAAAALVRGVTEQRMRSRHAQRQHTSRARNEKILRCEMISFVDSPVLTHMQCNETHSPLNTQIIESMELS